MNKHQAVKAKAIRRERQTNELKRTDDPIADHVDGCTCARCAGLERCPSCGQIKLDIDWCWSERRLVL